MSRDVTQEPRTDQHRPSRRLALAGLGATSVGLAGAVVPTTAHAAPDGEMAEATVHATTIADLQAAAEPDEAALYYVTDHGKQGAFYFDAGDRRTADNTGTVLVSDAGHRFKRVVEGPLRLSWFGATADYNPRNGNGTPADDAFDLALAALEDYASPAPPQGGHRRGLPTIAFEAGNYVFRRPGHAPQWARGVHGLHLQGHGMSQTNVYVDCAEADHGQANHFLVNDGRDHVNLGVVNTYSVDGITFHGVTGTERFMLYADTPGAGVAKRMYFNRSSWHYFRTGIDLQGRVNTDHCRFVDCLIQDESTESVFFNSNNPQAQNHDFVDCHFETHGRIFHFVAGGNLHIRGCQITTMSPEAAFLHIEPGDGGAIGIGNGTYNLTDINPEIREGKLLHVNAPEANVTFSNPRLIHGNAQSAANWADGAAHSVGDVVRAGYSEVEHPSKQRAFRCLEAHTASAENRPRTGAEWSTYWEALYELQIDAGSVHIRGGILSLSTLMTYGDAAYEGGVDRGTMMISDGCRLVNPVADLVEFAATEEVTNAASLPRVIATGCRPYTGTASGAYAATPYDPVDVSLNAEHGFEGAIPPVNRFVFAANPEAGQGLPSHDDGECTFKLPRGAHVLGVRLVSTSLRDAHAYLVTNHDGSRTFLPQPGGDRGVDRWYSVDSETKRTFRVSSRSGERADGFFLVEYI